MEIIVEPDKEFKEQGIRMLIKLMELRNLGKTTRESTRKKQVDLKNVIPEIINTLEESTAYCEHRNMDQGHGRQTSGNQPIRTAEKKILKTRIV